jgi:bacteriorhodopsin
VAYFAMASDLGWSVIATSLHRGDAATYQIFFAKYVFWVVSFPVIIIALGLISGVSWATIFFNVFLAWAWYVTFIPCIHETLGEEVVEEEERLKRGYMSD